MYNKDQVIFLTLMSFFIIMFTLFFWAFILSCTYNISMIHSEESKDTIDTKQDPSTDLKTDLSIPAL